MFPSRKQRWALMSGVAGIVGAQVAERLLTSSWRLAQRRDPPKDPTFDDVDWRSALLWTAAAGAAVSIVQLVARQGAAVAWHEVTGKRPPQPRKRPRVKSVRAALR
jgi:hypothetical protein